MTRFDLAALLGCAALALALVPLRAGRARVLAATCAAQGWTAGLAAVWEGWARGEPALYGLALAAVAVNGALLPRGLARAGSSGAVGLFPTLLGLGVVALALFAVQPVPGGVGAHEGLVLALATVLTGLAAAAMRDGAAGATGFGAVGSGLVLAAASVPGLPAQANAAVAAALVAVAAALAAERRGRA